MTRIKSKPKKLHPQKKGRLHKPTAIDLFSGCGGMTLGLKLAGFRVIGAVDNDPLSNLTYKTNHRNVIVFEKNIIKLSATKFRKILHLHKGDLDLLAGCPPCQGFSLLRTMKGTRRVRDSQKNLVYDFIRFVKKLEPKTVMMENVPGLAKDRRMRDLIKRLTSLGYECNYAILNAANYGVPQRRKRLILLASLLGKIEFARPNANFRTVRDAIQSMPPGGKSGDPLHDHSETRSARVKRFIKDIPRDGGSRTDLSRNRQIPCHKDFGGFADVYGRMWWDRVSPTITCGCINPSKGRFLHPKSNRTITLREAALLQSFPSGYFFSLMHGKYSVANLIGNALPPEFIRRHALEVKKHLRLGREKNVTSN